MGEKRLPKNLVMVNIFTYVKQKMGNGQKVKLRKNKIKHKNRKRVPIIDDPEVFISGERRNG